MRYRFVALAACLAGVAGSSSATTVYTDSVSFLANTAPGISFNDFDSLTTGSSPDLSYSFGSFSYDISSGNGGGLFIDATPSGSAVSTSSSSDFIRIDFTSGNVTAVGGNFYATNVAQQPITGDIRINLSDGTQVDFIANGYDDFRGFISTVAITSMEIRGINDFEWASMDNLYVGVNIIPLPPAAWAGLATLGLAGGVRAWRRRG